MALNLWKIGGKPTSYNPLPTGAININLTNIGDYRVIVKARSLTNGTILTLQWDDGGSQKELKSISLTTTTVEYVWDFTTDKPCPFYIIRGSGTPDIIIDSIELVQRPLPKLTLNGVDGFTSGKWSSSAHGTVIDDMTYSLNATVIYENITCVVPVLPNTTYSYSFSWSGNTPGPRIQLLDANGNDVGNPVNGGANNSGNFFATFTTTSTTVNVRIYAQANSVGLVTFKNLMLNLGSTPAPYSRKIGDKMMLPVAKKNLVTTQDTTGTTTSGTVDTWDFKNFLTLDNQADGSVLVTTSSTAHGFRYCFNAKSGKTYTFSFKVKKGTMTNWKYSIYDITNTTDLLTKTDYGVNLSSDSYTTVSFTFTSIKDTKLGVYPLRDSGVLGTVYLKDFQLEEGTATVFESYNAQVNKKTKKTTVKARTGIAFDGVTDSINCGSFAPYSKFTVEVKFKSDVLGYQQPISQHFDTTQAKTGWSVKLRNDGSVWFRIGTETSNSDLMIPNVYSIGEIVTLKCTFDGTTMVLYKNGIKIGSMTSSYTITNEATPLLIAKGFFGELFKGTIYYAKLFDGSGNLVRSYDFENPSNIVGTSVLQNAVNLIPSFEDARWSLHPSTQVLGKDVLRLNAAQSFLISYITLDVVPNKTYIVNCFHSGEFTIRSGNSYNGSTIYGASIDYSIPISDKGTFTVPNDVNQITLRLANRSLTGTFDFIRPQLYALSGNEGTLNGAPTPSRKQNKRILYNKR
jgi:hypothetical protein